MIYVNNVTGTAFGPGTLANPYDTVPGAAPSAAASDGVILMMNTGVTYTDTFVINSVSGTSGQPMILAPEDPNDPPVCAPTSPWRFQGVNWWIIENNLFDYGAGPGTDNYMVKLGVTTDAATMCTNFVIRGNRFTHSSFSGLGLEHVEDILVERNHFLDLRRRVAGVDTGAIEIKYVAHNVLIQFNSFEDIGSDPIEVEEKVTVGAETSVIRDITVQYNVAWVNRPYGIKSWQDFSSNVGENWIDIKDTNIGDGVIIVRGNVAFGFRTTVAGQDASGSSGEGISIHNDTAPMTTPRLFDGNIVYQCDQGITLNDNTGTGTGGVFVNNIVFDCDDWTFNAIDAAHGLWLYNNTFANSAGGFRIGGSSPGSLINAFYNNIIFNVDGTLSRGTVTDAGNVGNNCWNGNTNSTPGSWVVGTNVTSSPDLNARLAPSSGSPVVGAGATHPYDGFDFINQARPATPSIGAYEPEPALPSGTIVSDNFRHLNLPSEAVTDTDSSLFISFLARDMADSNEVGLKANMDNSNGRYITYSFAGMTIMRFVFSMSPANIPMANTDDFGFLTVFDGGDVTSSIRLNYVGGNYGIVVRMFDNLTNQNYVSDANGDIISNEPHAFDVWMGWGPSSGFMYLFIDGSLVASNTGIDNDSYLPDSFRYGPSGGIDAGTGGEETYILLGPVTLYDNIPLVADVTPLLRGVTLGRMLIR